jgi:hypothetical protein
MSATPRKTLLEPGHEAEWAVINREEEEQLHASNRALTPTQRLKDSDLLVPDGPDADAAVLRFIV